MNKNGCKNKNIHGNSALSSVPFEIGKHHGNALTYTEILGV